MQQFQWRFGLIISVAILLGAACAPQEKVVYVVITPTAQRVAAAMPAAVPVATVTPDPEIAAATAEALSIQTAAALGAQTATAFAKQQAIDATATAKADAIIAVTATYEAVPVFTSNEIFKKWEGMTDIQKPVYEASLPGTRIRDQGKILNVYESGRVSLSVSGVGLFQSVSLYGLSKETLLTLGKGDTVKFEGAVRKFLNAVGQSIEVDKVTILP